MLKALFHILIFPGFLFLFIAAFAAEFMERKIYARLQNRVGPPWFQPLADFIKLSAKEDVVPGQAEKTLFNLVPLLALTSAITAMLYVPMWRGTAVFSFSGDIIVVLYLLTIPTITYFLGGWYSRSVYSMIGAVRSLIQLFAYEVPFFVCILSGALLADSWSLAGIADFYTKHPGYWLFNIVGFFIALVSLLGKLEKTPFDIPEAETEIVAGCFTEYGGRLLALFRMSLNIEMVVAASLLAAVFLPFGLGLPPALAMLVYFLKLIFIVSVVSLAHAAAARLRIDQMINVCWRFFAPLAFFQVLFNLILKAVLAK